jgi:hypothetical protein
MIWGAERTFYTFVSIEERDPDHVVEAIGDFWLRALYGSDDHGAAMRSGR